MVGATRQWLSPLAFGLLLLALPGKVGAHGAGLTRFEAPLPLPLLLVGAGATVALTAIWLGFRPTLADRGIDHARTIDLPAGTVATVRTAVGVGFLGLVVVALVVGATGRQVPAENLATVFVWPIWIHGLAILAVLVGSPWATLSPWRTVYRGLSWLEGDRLSIVGRYPTRLGAWPALLGFLFVIGLVENLTVVPRSPQLTTVLISGYALTMVVGAILWGESWLRCGDPLGVFYHLLGRVAPLQFDHEANDRSITLRFRPPWRGTLAPVSGLPTVVIVVAAVFTVSFDGLTETATYQALLFGVRGALGIGEGTSVLLYLAGLAGFLGLFGLTVGLAEALAKGDLRSWRPAAIRFAPTVLPIAAAYEVAHTYPYVVWNLGRLPGLLVPSAGAIEPLGWLSVPAFWGSQVVLILGGHVIAVVAAHQVCMNRYRTPSDSRRGHLPLVVLMVGFTVLSLWIISQPVVTG